MTRKEHAIRTAITLCVLACATLFPLTSFIFSIMVFTVALQARNLFGLIVGPTFFALIGIFPFIGALAFGIHMLVSINVSEKLKYQPATTNPRYLIPITKQHL